ncbi:TetR/AcrR family transcriptional regulator [Ferrovibrio sp.]|uniref:TetR/AcrR family transcriptional regulator n=1 Tax=Ferrovibrio sp. TaxID=1917215 RepID=UPI002625A541|nr:TetR/AcrR family transcriptional regulator [Ferrovibrio sp.]
MPAALLSREDAITRIAEVFREHGFAGSSLSAITEATGLGKGSLYNHFPGGKDQMGAEVLAHIDGWFETQVYAPLRQSDDPRVAITAMFDAVDAYFRSGRRICLVGAFALDATRDRFAAAVQGYFTHWIDALALALAAGGAADALAHAHVLAESAVAGIQGALTLSRALNDPAVFMRQMQEMRARLNAALA